MGTGKELARMMECGIWKDYILPRKDYCSAQIFDRNGKPISITKAKQETFCHSKIIFKECPEGELKLLALILKMVASTSSEQMWGEIHNYYRFQEIIIA